MDTVCRKFQETMREDLVSGVELLTGRRGVLPKRTTPRPTTPPKCSSWTGRRSPRTPPSPKRRRAGELTAIDGSGARPQTP